MLVLTRKSGESICIGDEVEVRIVGVRGQKVRIAIEAPREISVRRSELQALPQHGGLRLNGRFPIGQSRRAAS